MPTIDFLKRGTRLFVQQVSDRAVLAKWVNAFNGIETMIVVVFPIPSITVVIYPLKSVPNAVVTLLVSDAIVGLSRLGS